jgi:hypothetical protein
VRRKAPNVFWTDALHERQQQRPCERAAPKGYEQERRRRVPDSTRGSDCDQSGHGKESQQAAQRHGEKVQGAVLEVVGLAHDDKGTAHAAQERQQREKTRLEVTASGEQNDMLSLSRSNICRRTRQDELMPGLVRTLESW